MTLRRHWVAFYHNGVELCRYSLYGSFDGECEETIQLLAYEKGVHADEIYWKIIYE